MLLDRGEPWQQIRVGDLSFFANRGTKQGSQLVFVEVAKGSISIVDIKRGWLNFGPALPFKVFRLTILEGML